MFVYNVLLQHCHQANDDGDNPDEATPRCRTTFAQEVEYPTEDFHSPSQEAECQKDNDDECDDTEYFH